MLLALWMTQRAEPFVDPRREPAQVTPEAFDIMMKSKLGRWAMGHGSLLWVSFFGFSAGFKPNSMKFDKPKDGKESCLLPVLYTHLLVGI